MASVHVSSVPSFLFFPITPLLVVDYLTDIYEKRQS